MSAAVASVLQRSSNSENGFIVTNTKICSAPSMKLGPRRWLMLSGRLGRAGRVAPSAGEEAPDLGVIVGHVNLVR